jgi:hypothetical protein
VVPQASVAAEAVAAAIRVLPMQPEDVACIVQALASAAAGTNKHLAHQVKLVDELDILAAGIEDDLRERAGG